MKTLPSLKKISKLPLDQVLPKLFYIDDDCPENLAKSIRNMQIFARIILLGLTISFCFIMILHIIALMGIISIASLSLMGYIPTNSFDFLHILGAIVSSGVIFCAHRAMMGCIQLAKPQETSYFPKD